MSISQYPRTAAVEAAPCAGQERGVIPSRLRAADRKVFWLAASSRSRTQVTPGPRSNQGAARLSAKNGVAFAEAARRGLLGGRVCLAAGAAGERSDIWDSQRAAPPESKQRMCEASRASQKRQGQKIEGPRTGPL